MQRLTSLAAFRLTLLTALGASGVIACSGTVTDHSNGRAADGDAGVESGGAAGSGTGGKGYGGTGGWNNPTDGGAANGGAGGWTTGGAPGGGTGGQGGFGGSAACNNPVPIGGAKPGEPSGGFVQCEDYTIHRVAVAACWDHIDPSTGPTILDAPDGSVTVACTKNSDCTDHPHGYCQGSYYPPGGFGGVMSYQCNYGCTADSECGAGQICLCGEPVGRCVEAHCKSDADCGSTFCKQWYRPSGCSNEAVFSCDPLCVTNEDCSSVLGGSGFCSAGNCQGPVCGRPFLVDGFAVLADPKRRGDWSSEVSPDVSELSAETRRALAEHYTAIGLMEHASVAAFARFSLELLSMGAPAELVEESTAALSDETRHARICFGLAAVYGGTDVGPGRLATESALSATSVLARVKTAFLEACVGETLAAVEVAESALRASDLAVKALLGRIAEDETRHAALGFRFVKWALERMDESSRAELVQELWGAFDDEANAVLSATDLVSPDPMLVAHGVLPAAERRALRDAAFRDVVTSCVRALLGERATRRAA